MEFVDREVVKKEFKRFFEYIENLRNRAIYDSKDPTLDSSYYEGKAQAYYYIKSEVRYLYQFIMSADGYIIEKKDNKYEE